MPNRRSHGKIFAQILSEKMLLQGMFCFAQFCLCSPQTFPKYEDFDQLTEDPDINDDS
jgi:hypothetical protein